MYKRQATYYVKELYAPDGFVTNDEVKEFTFEYVGENQPTVTYDFTFDNQPTVVEFAKSSLTTGKELPGCKLKVVDSDGNIVDEWTSGKEAHVIRELTVGKEYTLVETKPADGYVTAESVKFTIKDTADVQKVEDVYKRQTFTDTLQDQKYFMVLEIVEVFVLSGFFEVFQKIFKFFVVPHCKTGSQRFVI